ncbi:hypothetical protein DSM112329_01873 [Paraconexibacter sp. AEG42_29]|uniref:HTH luxR-type domain-containing protein n=1 Tax=Paraconexibacter sp. AEG42_29 TaxID=2997339 RepID=A0AAU7AU59_9ACTN
MTTGTAQSAGTGGAATAGQVAARIRRLQRQRLPLPAPGWDHHTTRLAITHAMRRLRAAGTTSALIEAAPAELCRSCGFSRAMISRLTPVTWTPVALHSTIAGDARLNAGFAAARGVPIPLRHTSLEADIARRRVPLLVPHAATDRRVSAEYLDRSGCDAYLVVPVVDEDRVIALLHADRLGQTHPADAEDRDNALAFAQELGVLVQRAVIAQRLAEQTAELTERLRALAQADLDADDGPPLRRPAALGAAAKPVPHRPAGAARLLSPRELDVLELVTAGATNKGIAAQLTITPGTVKSHVKRILAKTRTSTRSEAAAWYLRQAARTAA